MIKVFCSWCKKFMYEKQNEKDFESHGICEACGEKFKADAESLRARLVNVQERDRKVGGR